MSNFGGNCRSLVAPHNWTHYRFASSTREKLITSNGHEAIAQPIGLSAPGRVSLPTTWFFEVQRTRSIENGAASPAASGVAGIKGTPGEHVTIGILAERLGIRHNSTVELIDRLIMNGLVERRHNPRDHREVLIDLTNRAERILANLSLAHRNEIRKFAPLLIELLARSDSQKSKRRKRRTRRMRGSR